MTISEVGRHIVDTLRSKAGYTAEKAVAVRDILFEDRLGMDRVKTALYPDRVLLPETVQTVDLMLEKLVEGMPVQYVVGKARFMGMDLKVTPDVLIPRQETATLVDMIVDRYKERRDLRIIDFCTGSGCIALGLARALKYPEIEGVDISRKALDIAKENAYALNADIKFVQGDVCNLDYNAFENCDIIVSNPPYILENERADVAKDVLAYEPAIALFVPDEDPVKYYREIAKFAAEKLEHGGGLFFEINPGQVRFVEHSIQSAGLKECNAYRDFNGIIRYVSAYKV